jgi:hypothetical protein
LRGARHCHYSLGATVKRPRLGILLVIAIAGAYAWRATRPHARGTSDTLVREFVEIAQKDVRSGRRAIDRAADKVRTGVALDEVIKMIEDATAASIKSIEEKAQDAIYRLEQIDEITLKTEQNRRNRIHMRLDAMRQTLTEAKTDAIANARNLAEGQAPE